MPGNARMRDALQLGSYYELRIGGVLMNSGVVDSITVDEQEDRIRTMNVSLIGMQDSLKRLQVVTLWGGSEDVNNQRWIFKGRIKAINVKFPPDGVPMSQVSCWGGAWRAARKTKKLTYPNLKSEREWAKVNEIKLSDIVKNIMSDTFYDMDQVIDIKKDKTFTLKNPFTQTGTDWYTLRILAKVADCILTETVSDKTDAEHQILFVDRESYSKNTETQKELPIAFRYNQRHSHDGEGHTEFDFVYPDGPKNGELMVDDIDLNMDVDLNSGSLRQVYDFDEGETDGQYNKAYFQKYDEETGGLFTYELNQQAVERDFAKGKFDGDGADLGGRRLMERLNDLSDEEVEQYFTKVENAKNKVPGYEKTDVGMTGAGGLGWVGFEMKITLLGDVRIQPYRMYPIYGIGSYSTGDKRGMGKWYLRSMSHTWGEEGYKQELNFYK